MIGGVCRRLFLARVSAVLRAAEIEPEISGQQNRGEPRARPEGRTYAAARRLERPADLGARADEAGRKAGGGAD